MDIYSAIPGRKVAVSELLLTERHHLGTPNSRCQECETAHLQTASALLSEASRMKDGSKDDFKLAEQIDNLDLSKPREELQQEVRQVRKEINKQLGIKDCDGTCSLDKLNITTKE